MNFYRAVVAAGGKKSNATCPSCFGAVSIRGCRKLREEPTVDVVRCSCTSGLLNQPHVTPPTAAQLDGLRWPDVEITPDRQMYQASALGRHGLTSTAKFFSERNLAVLAAVRMQIDREPDPAIQKKLLFAFTGILARASKRYQWGPKGPLNAANQNYYVAPIFYEWNVYDLFVRKSVAVLKSDAFLRAERVKSSAVYPIDVSYVNASAHELPLPRHSVDYVFTDPPFGSNIFYSDMNLFQEAWIGELTDHAFEAVVDRSGERSPARYEGLLSAALAECNRVLRTGGHLSLVFSNSSGAVWALVQRAVSAAGFSIIADGVHLLDKGQRSVKGLASGFENVVTMDLILTMRKLDSQEVLPPLHSPTEAEIEAAVASSISSEGVSSVTHVYLSILRTGMLQGWSLADLNFSRVAEVVTQIGRRVDPVTARFLPGG